VPDKTDAGTLWLIAEGNAIPKTTLTFAINDDFRLERVEAPARTKEERAARLIVGELERRPEGMTHREMTQFVLDVGLADTESAALKIVTRALQHLRGQLNESQQGRHKVYSLRQQSDLPFSPPPSGEDVTSEGRMVTSLPDRPWTMDNHIGFVHDVHNAEGREADNGHDGHNGQTYVVHDVHNVHDTSGTMDTMDKPIEGVHCPSSDLRCDRCGSPLERVAGGWACPACDLGLDPDPPKSSIVLPKDDNPVYSSPATRWQPDPTPPTDPTQMFHEKCFTDITDIHGHEAMSAKNSTNTGTFGVTDKRTSVQYNIGEYTTLKITVNAVENSEGVDGGQGQKNDVRLSASVESPENIGTFGGHSPLSANVRLSANDVQPDDAAPDQPENSPIALPNDEDVVYSSPAPTNSFVPDLGHAGTRDWGYSSIALPKDELEVKVTCPRCGYWKRVPPDVLFFAEPICPQCGAKMHETPEEDALTTRQGTEHQGAGQAQTLPSHSAEIEHSQNKQGNKGERPDHECGQTEQTGDRALTSTNMVDTERWIEELCTEIGDNPSGETQGGMQDA
jgi:Zn finger protein HypA/HybF involved in hydrogenase expression